MVERRRPRVQVPRVWVVEIDGQPVVAYPAVSQQEARQLPKENWFKDDLLSLRSNGVALWDGKARLTVRPAAPAEIIEFNQAMAVGDELVLAYLVPLDGPAR